MKKVAQASIGLALIAGCIFLSFQIGKHTSNNSRSETKLQERYNLLSKRVFIENPSDKWLNFTSLRKSLNNYYSQNGLNGSVYFEYLPTGTSIRIRDSYQQVAASLIKLPAAMELYKAAELGKVNLDQKVKLKNEWLNSDYGDLYKKGVGYELTYRQAVKILLEQSDNTALRVVLAAYGGKLNTDDLAFGSLDVDFSQNPDGTINIAARGYSSFFKCLYYACYNNFSDSQEILSYLSNASATNRLVAGVGGKATAVAHKIGTFNTKAQSDCGIVYYPNRNYALCVMVDGSDPLASKHIADMSKITYDYINNLR